VKHTGIAALQKQLREQENLLDELLIKVSMGARVLAQAEGAWPVTEIPGPGVWSSKWEGPRFRFGNLPLSNYPTRPIVRFDSERTYELLSEYGQLAHVQAVWAQLEPRLAAAALGRGNGQVREIREVSGTVVPDRSPESLPAPTRDAEDGFARKRQALLELMVDYLVEFPENDVMARGMVEVLASRRHISGATLSGWFSGSGRTLRQHMTELLDKASELAAEQRRRGAR
jgi:hypothetical protein